MGKVTPTPARRRLGSKLRAYREEAGKTLVEAAQGVGSSVSAMSLLEDGRGRIKPDELEALANLYSLDDRARAELGALGEKARQRAPRWSYASTLPVSYQEFESLESDATEICTYHPSVIPALLQSAGYAASLISVNAEFSQNPSVRRQESQVSYSLKRQAEIWGGTSQRLHFVIGENAINDLVESNDVMSEQMRHLLALSYRNSNGIIQILPAKTPRYPARTGGFTLFHTEGLPSIGIPAVAYMPSVFIDDFKQTDTMARVFGQLARLSLSPDDSRRLLEARLQELQR